MTRRVLVTGANGFVARALRSRTIPGCECVWSSRNCPDTEKAAWRRSPDLSASADWRSTLEGIDSVVHLAGRVHLPADKDPAAYFVENLEGTTKLARDAIASGVRRFVFLSSAKVFGDESGAAPFNEATSPAPGDPYAASKLAAEEELIAMGTQLEVAILRPPLVYGPGVRANFLALLAAVARGVPLPLASIRNRRSLISVDNLATAIVGCLNSSVSSARTYCVSDGLPVSTPDLVRAIAAALGKSPRLFAFPSWLLESCGAAIGRPETIKRLTRSLELNDQAIRTELGWQPTQTFEEAIVQTVRWYESLATNTY